MQPWQTALTFGDVLDAHVRQRPEKLALAGVNGQTVTFGQMNQRINRLYHGLSARGVQTGDRVAILSYNRPEYLEVFGLSKAGLIIVPLNWRLAAAELLRLLSHSGARVLLAEASFVPLVETLREQLPGLEVLVVLDDGTGTSDLSQTVEAAETSGAPESAAAPALSVLTGWLPYESLAARGDDAEPPFVPGHTMCCVSSIPVAPREPPRA
ncbi:AMP-binding protein [Neopusillimonas aromaticivorans]|uniref:AMP-binding protein n=1 Tax=Neopusillimonas aromaticivorans TaxID=2979868 RepID=UPI002599C655|nr:AMP-binding protein [Neopusillimonas aromaticivorans]WJJ92611.1 AMP-binding protein [Neopusillimonas aromaticivorans]